MRLPILGGLLIFSVLTLCGCLSPLTQRQAQTYAQRSLRGYCNPGAPCRFVKAQHMAPGWLLDFESANAKYGVMVNDDGGTEISVWSKEAAAAAN